MALDTLKLPERLPSSTHEVIVLLEEVHIILNNIDTAPRTHEYISYRHINKEEEIRERIQCASIVIAPQAFITTDSLGEAPYLKCVITPTAGTNHIDVEECRRRGIKVARCLGSTSLAVPEHALSLYFAARRKTIMLHNEIRTVDESGKNSWKRQGSIASKMKTANGHPPYSLKQEVAGIIGYGAIGKSLDVLCKALGMKVHIAERKAGGPSRRNSNGQAVFRTPFDEVIRSVTVLFICCTLDETSHNMIDVPELSAMQPEAIIINVSRAGVMNTAAVIHALRQKQISGVAVDVFEKEPACTEEDSAFLAANTAGLNLTLSPHVGYYSTKTVLTMEAMVKEHIKNFVSGNYINFVV
ncbi:hypothetical protein K445DRAFT_369360 [Daldinia sp. EC12]|nr:hypothetical protein K445DRAFT_369360 [Daldinia sp. EC12]